MVIKKYSLILILLTNFIESYYISSSNKNTTLYNFSFGSCFKYRYTNNIFETILKNNPQLWIWSGDAIYVAKWRDAEEMFNKTKHNKYYEKLKEKIPTIGTWDDHDYGKNDGNRNFKKKDYFKKLFLDFIDEEKYSIRRKENRGIYYSYSFGDPNSYKTVKFILLDVRYDKDSFWQKDPDILGEEQWIWLEQELNNSNETFTFIITGTQFLPFNRFVTEAWYYYSRKKMFSLINKTKKSGVIIISGDVHSGQILKTPCILQEIGYHLHEITSSGLTHNAIFSRLIFDYILPNDYMILNTVEDINFGFIEFEWGKNKLESKFIIKLKNLQNINKLQYRIKYKNLIFKGKNSQRKLSNMCSLRVNSRMKLLKDYYLYYSKNPLQIIFLLLYVLFVLFILFLIWGCVNFFTLIITFVKKRNTKIKEH